MICPFCGGPANDTAKFCEHCGRQLKSGLRPYEPQADPTKAKCRWCGLPLTKGDPVCRYCYRDNSEKDPDRKFGAILMAGGLIVIVAGLFSLAATISLALPDIDTYAEDTSRFAIYIMLALCAIFAIGLGALPLMRKNFRLSLAGGIFSLLGGAFFIGVFGLILIILGRKGFKN
jgi:hypothetical protein